MWSGKLSEQKLLRKQKVRPINIRAWQGTFKTHYRIIISNYIYVFFVQFLFILYLGYQFQINSIDYLLWSSVACRLQEVGVWNLLWN